MKFNVTRFPQIFTLLVMISIGTTRARAQIASQAYQGHDAAANEVLIKFQQPAPTDAPGQAKVAADIQQAEVTADIDLAQTVGSAGWMRFHSRSNDVTTLIGMLTGGSSVVFVEPNWMIEPATTPNDPDFPLQWGLHNTETPGADIGAVSAWSIATGSPATLVGLLDSGISYTHPDLAANVWSAPSQYSFLMGTTGYTCPAGAHGFNEVSKTCDPAETDLPNGHGTASAGIIGAVGNNDIGIAGVNWRTAIITCVFWTPTTGGSTADAINCLQFMEGVKAFFDGRSGAANIRVLNMSYNGSGFSQAFLNEIDNTYAADMLFVASAGNNGTDNDTTPTYPANYSAPNVISVAATDIYDHLASTAYADGFNSNYGPNTVHLGAPGAVILTTAPGGNYLNFGGTSEAAPFVAGTAALSLSVCGGDTDWLVPNILNNVVKTSPLTGKTITGGRVNAYNALQAGSNACPGTGDGVVDGWEQSTTVKRNGQWVTVYDSGSISLTVNGATKTVYYGEYDTAHGLAISLANLINGDSTYPVRAHLSDSSLSIIYFADVILCAKTTGPGTCYTLTTGYTYDTTDFHTPSFHIYPSGTALVGCK